MNTNTFSDYELRPGSLQALARMGITAPTPIQAGALPHLLDGRDVIGQARTGSGKTLAFGLPLLEAVDPHARRVQALVLTPTRELATQVGSVLDSVAQGSGIRTVLVFGGRSMVGQEAELRRGAQVVVGAPGRVLDLMRRGTLRMDGLRYLVLDEADEMLDRGFAPDVERILGMLPKDRQTAMFSATVPSWVLQTSTKHLRQPVKVQVDTRPEDVPVIDHVAYEVPAGTRLGVLKTLLDGRGDGSTIVFGRTKHGVKKLARILDAAGYPVAALQGNLSQNARDRVMADFRSGAVRILLATNVAARGLDVDHVELVVNYELPESAELLTHRVGRTGRMGREGRAVTLLQPEDLDKWRQMERTLGRRIRREAWRGTVVADAPPPRASVQAGTGLRERGMPAREQVVSRERGTVSREQAVSRERGTVSREQAAARERGSVSREQAVSRERGSVSREQAAARERGSVSREQAAARERGTVSREQAAARERGSVSREQAAAREQTAARERGTVSRERAAARERGSVSREQAVSRERGSVSREQAAARERDMSSRRGTESRDRGTAPREQAGPRDQRTSTRPHVAQPASDARQASPQQSHSARPSTPPVTPSRLWERVPSDQERRRA